MSDAFPFLAIARANGLDYGEVIRTVQWMEHRGPPLDPPHKLVFNVASAQIRAAIHREFLRRQSVRMNP